MAVDVINTRYEILEKLQATGTNQFTAYKARDINAGKIVTIRVFSDRFNANPKNAIDKLTLAIHKDKLDNPAILHTVDAGVLDDTQELYIVMDYVPGITLKERIRRVAPFSLGVAVDFAVSIAEALAAAHNSGSCHGALRPTDIIVSPEGFVRVAGFQTGAIIEEFSSTAGSNALPYIKSNSGLEESTSSDIYALGVILYEMLTGFTPIEAESRLNSSLDRGASLTSNSANAQGTPRGIRDVPPSPRALNPGIPPAIDGITLKAIHPDPDTRYNNVTDMLLDLKAVQSAFRSGRSLSWSPLPDVQKAAPGSIEIAGSKTKAAWPPDASEMEDNDVNEYSEKDPPNSLGIAVRILFVVAICGIVVLGWFFKNFLSPPAEVEVPNFIGRTVDDVRLVARQKKIQLNEIEGDFSKKWPEGQIYSQDPPAGRIIRAGKTVSIHVSKGPESLTVPTITGLANDKAIKILRDAALPLGTVTEEFSETVPKGVIISQEPISHTNVKRNTAVNFVVSKGKQPPDAPTNIQADALSSDRIEIKWQAAERAKYYKITRAVDGTATDIATKVKDTKYTDTGLKPDTSYTYIITSVNEVGESAPSEGALAYTPAASVPSTPDNQSSPSSDNSGTPVTDNTPVTSAQPVPNGDNKTTDIRQFRIRFRVPRRPDRVRHVQFYVVDSTGTLLEYDAFHQPGDRINTPVSAFGSKVTIKIMIDNELVKQQVL